MSQLAPGVRIADEAIYLNENRYETVKESFKFMGNLMETDLTPNHHSLLDVGCATGEFIYYLHSRFPRLSYVGTDVSEKMVKQAAERIPFATFSVASVLDKEFFKKFKFDLVQCSGVIQMFDDLKTPLYNLIDALNPGGALYILSPVNNDPIDLYTRYFDHNDPLERMQLGWNIHSKKLYSKLIDAHPYKASHSYHEFRLPFHLPKKSDPMRTWTILAPDGRGFQLVNGACQMINLHVIRVIRPNAKRST